MDSPKIVGKALVQAFAERGPALSWQGESERPASRARLLVIVRDAASKKVRLLYCDEHWSVIDDADVDGLNDALERSESEFPGISDHWQIRNYTEKDLEPADRSPLCSFCELPHYRVQGMVEGESAHICYECVRKINDMISAG